MDEQTASRIDAPGAGTSASSHPSIDGYTLVTTPPLPPYLSGGFGRVYRALSPDHVLVAIKVPGPDARSAGALARWLDECRESLALPPHEHVVRFFQRTTARWADGSETPALVMEWLEGARGLIPFADALGLDKSRRLDLFEQALEGVAWLHTHHTPHCDLKSSNMLVIERGPKAVVKITDFGGTRRAGHADPRPPVYSPQRVAPEVVAGDPAAIDTRADVYSLGKELAELIGGPAATWSPAGDHHAWRSRPLERYLGLADPLLDAIISRATATERSHRFTDAQEMLDAIRAYRPRRREQWSRAIEHWIWPARQSSRIGRPLRVMALIAAAIAIAALMLANTIFAMRAGPRLTVGSLAPSSFDRVVAFHAEPASADPMGEPNGLMRVASILNIEDVDPARPATLRRVWARVLNHVVEQGAAAVVFVVTFPQNDDELLNTVIAEAIANAKAKGVPVIVAVPTYHRGPADEHPQILDPDTGKLVMRPTAKAVIAAGAVCGCDRVEWLDGIDRALIIPRNRGGELRPPQSVAAVAAILGDPPPTQPVLSDAETSLVFPGQDQHGRRIKLFDLIPHKDYRGDPTKPLTGVEPDEVIGIYPLAIPPATAFTAIEHDVADLWTDDPSERERLRSTIDGRIVLLGFAGAGADLPLTAAHTGPPSRLHAVAIESLLAEIDAPQTRLPSIIAAITGTLLGFTLSVLIVAALLRSAKLPMPSLEGQWTPSRVPPLVAARRWRRVALASAIVAAAIALAWLVVPRLTEWDLPYAAGVLTTGVFVGVCTGAVVVLFASWMGLVRRAWCLDRVPEPA